MDAGGAGGGGDGGARREEGDDFLLSGRQDAAVLGVRGDRHFQRYLSDCHFIMRLKRNPGAIPYVAIDSRLLSCQTISGNMVTGMGRRTQVRHPAEIHRREACPTSDVALAARVSAASGSATAGRRARCERLSAGSTAGRGE